MSTMTNLVIIEKETSIPVVYNYYLGSSSIYYLFSHIKGIVVNCQYDHTVLEIPLELLKDEVDYVTENESDFQKFKEQYPTDKYRWFVVGS